ncbi:MAG: PqqD family protein [Bacteroidia bacterium]
MSKRKDNINYLELTPVIKSQHRIEGNGNISVLIPRFESKFWSKIFSRNGKEFIPLKLDEIGSETWKMIDGKKNVQQLCDELKEKLGEKIHPAEERVTKFLSQLYLHKFIQFTELKK